AGTYAFVADGAAGVAVLDVADPTAAFVATTIALSGSVEARDVVVAALVSPTIGTEKPYQIVLAVAAGAGGGRIFDVDKPIVPVELTAIESSDAAALGLASAFVPGDTFTPASEVDLLAVADSADGLLIYELLPLADPLPLGSFSEAGFTMTSIS